MAPDIASLVPFVVSIRRECDGEEVPGVFVQGPNAPCILTCLHAFKKDPGHGTPGKQYHGSFQVPLEAFTCVVLDWDNDHDFLVLEVVTKVNKVTAPVNFIDTDSYLGSPYILFGLSTIKNVEASRLQYTWNVCRGYVTTSLLSGFLYGSDAGCAPGDSGGPIFHSISGKLMGINVSVSLLHAGGSASEATMRVSPQGRFVPLFIIELVMKYKRNILFFGPGGVMTLYSSSPSTSLRCSPSNVIRKVQERPYEMLCNSPISGLEDLLDPDLLDPYQY